MGRVVFFLCILILLCKSAAGNPAPASALAGEWLVELNSNDIGFVKAIFTFETEDSTFSAHTREGADRDILGFWKSTLARTFTKDFRKGSLIRVTDGKVRESGDTLILKGIFRSAIGVYYFNGKIYNQRLAAQLADGRHHLRGNISGTKAAFTKPLSDYPAIASKGLDIAKQKIYSPTLTGTKDWRKFEKKLTSAAPEFEDDVEMVFAFFYYAGKLPVSHFALMKMSPEEETKANETAQRPHYVTIEEKTSSTAYMKISSFGGSALEMDSAFAIIRNRGYKNLIVDLRNNPGGSVEAGMSFAKNVVDSELIGGVFLTQKWFANNTFIPVKEQYQQFPYFTEANFDLIIDGIHDQEGLVLKVIPYDTIFQGDLYILTNRRTASTCEPLVYGLQHSRQATIVGERTAGAMLNGEIFDVGDGFSVIVPTADYYTIDGYRIDQQGVLPDIEVDADKALEYVLESLITD